MLLLLLVAAAGVLVMRARPPQLPPPSQELPPCSVLWERALARVRREHLDTIAADHARWWPCPGPALLERGPDDAPCVAVTFDDGPHPGSTPELLRILRQHHAHATFFVVGRQARDYPDLVRQIAREGHCLGNHAFYHGSLADMRQPELSTEIVACGDLLESLTGQRPHLLRPPGGRCTDRLLELTYALGYTTVLWTANPVDYLPKSRRQLRQEVFSSIAPGEILLLHDGAPNSQHLLASFLEYVEASGAQCVTIDEMLAQARAAAR